MLKENNELFNDIEAKLMQVQTLIEVILDNHNYQAVGYDEPFIDHHKSGNLMWAAAELVHQAIEELGELDFNIKNHY